MLPTWLFIIGFVIVMVGVLLLILSIISMGKERSVEGGGVIIIGPLPIVIGTSERITKALIILSIALFLISLFIFLVFTGVIKWM